MAMAMELNQEIVNACAAQFNQYMKEVDNQNVCKSPPKKLEIITEMYEWIVGDQNCKLYLLAPCRNSFFEILSAKVNELSQVPIAQQNARFMAVCVELNKFIENGRIHKANQAAAVAVEDVGCVFPYDNYHREADEHEARIDADADAAEAEAARIMFPYNEDAARIVAAAGPWPLQVYVDQDEWDGYSDIGESNHDDEDDEEDEKDCGCKQECKCYYDDILDRWFK